MAAQPNVLTSCRLFRRHRRIKVENAITPWVGCDAVKVVLRQLQTQREDLDQPPRELEAFLPVSYAAVLEAGEVGSVFPYKLFTLDIRLHLIRDRARVSSVRVILRRIAPAECFSVVEGFRGACVGGAAGGPAVEVFGFLFGDELFLRVGLVEERLGLVQGFLDHGGGDPVVFDVEEAGVFGGVFDLRGEGAAGGQLAVDRADVDEGDFVGVALAGWGGGDGAVDGLRLSQS